MFKTIFAWINKLINPVKPRDPIIKMYILVRTDLPPIHRAVQGGHAIAKYLLDFYRTNTDNEGRLFFAHKTLAIYQQWTNGVMIYLGVDDELELIKWETKLLSNGVNVASFIEPDWGTPTKTALACISYGDEFSELPLLNMNFETFTSHDIIPECMHNKL